MKSEREWQQHEQKKMKSKQKGALIPPRMLMRRFSRTEQYKTEKRTAHERRIINWFFSRLFFFHCNERSKRAMQQQRDENKTEQRNEREKKNEFRFFISTGAVKIIERMRSICDASLPPLHFYVWIAELWKFGRGVRRCRHPTVQRTLRLMYCNFT